MERCHPCAEFELSENFTRSVRVSRCARGLNTAPAKLAKSA